MDVDGSKMTGKVAGAPGSVRPQVVIVGAGFAGLNAAHALRRADVDVVLVDKNNFHTFQPLLYQVGTGYLDVEEVGTSLRQVFRRQANVEVRMGEVRGADWAEGTLYVGDDLQRFDYLVLAGGAETNFLGVPGMAEHAWPLYTLDDAIRLRMHLLQALERDASRWARRGEPMTTVVVGGGPTGVETAGALRSMAKEILGPDLGLRVVLVEAGQRLLSGFSPVSSERALTDLRRRGVEVLLDTTVESADEGGVTLAGGQRVDTTTVIWAAGVKGNHLAHALGIDVDRQGRVVVGPTLQVPDHPTVFAVGDIAVLLDDKGRSAVPMMAPAAIQMGRHAGEQIALLLAGRHPKRFRFRNKGIMAVLGRGDAVAELPVIPWGGKATLRFGGFLAWILWLGVHIVYLIGFRHRIKVLIDWGWSYFTSRGAGAILLPIPDRAPYDDASQRGAADRPTAGP